MLNYTAYLMAQRRVAEVARGAVPDSPVGLPEVARDPVFLVRSYGSAPPRARSSTGSPTIWSDYECPRPPHRQPVLLWHQSARHPAAPQSPIPMRIRDQRRRGLSDTAGTPSRRGRSGESEREHQHDR